MRPTLRRLVMLCCVVAHHLSIWKPRIYLAKFSPLLRTENILVLNFTPCIHRLPVSPFDRFNIGVIAKPVYHRIYIHHLPWPQDGAARIRVRKRKSKIAWQGNLHDCCCRSEANFMCWSKTRVDERNGSLKLDVLTSFLI